MKQALLLFSFFMLFSLSAFSQPCFDCKDPIVTIPLAGTSVSVTPDDLLDANTCAGALTLTIKDFSTGNIISGPASSVVFDCAATGQIFTAEVTDGVCAFTCATTIFIQDVETPNIDCAADPTFVLAVGNCEHFVNDNGLDPVNTSDNCNFSVFNDYNGSFSLQGTAFQIGTTLVNWEITDFAGNTTSCLQTIRVEGNASTTNVTCPPPFVVSADQFGCKAFVGFSLNFDDCDIEDLAVDFSGASNFSSHYATPPLFFNGFSFEFTPVELLDFGTTIVTANATDASGNFSTCNFSIDVMDFDSPFIGCPGDVTAVEPLPGTSAVVNNISPFWFDNCEPPFGVFISYSFSGATAGGGAFDASGSTFNLGTTTVTYVADDTAGNPLSFCSFDITVVNCNVDLGPDITACPGDLVLLDAGNPGAGSTYIWNSGETTQIISTDNDGSFSVTVTDPFGCMSDDVIGVTFVDNPIYVDCIFFTWVVDLDSSGIASIDPFDLINGFDDCPANPTISASPNTFNCNDLGTQPVTVTITDSNNNTSSCVTNVFIQDVIAPSLTCQDFTIELDSTGQATIDTDDILSFPSIVFDDNCSAASSSSAIYFFGCGQAGSVALVTFDISDPSGNTASCDVNVNVNDTTIPTMICPSDVFIVLPQGQSTAVVNGIELNCPGDNCGIQQINYNLFGATGGSGNNDASGTIFNQGITNVEYIVIDDTGNTAMCSFTVTLHGCDADLGPDLISCLNTPVLLDAGNPGSSYSWAFYAG